MSSGCKSSLSFANARVPVRATYLNLYKWPESDAEFAKSVARRRGRFDDDNNGCRRWSAALVEVDSYSCRQMYLRSYTFSRKPEKTLRCLKQGTALFACLQQKNEVNVNGENKKMKKKSLVTVKKMREVSCSAICFIFHRLLFCTAGVDVLRQE
ncbi:hypothetical protein Cni_G23648 [Canna indica]|uniref:Uncharacterized protein n=1 Tax=Canna indica TaxID=4628 RepID=A0AAQ3L0R1_9LILI|nr:hypothetical protein Cni_G23648 [Canna indica]